MSPITGESQRVPPYWWLLIFLLAAIVWSIDIGRPVDLPNWHEFDYSSIARNFVREGNNILFPRIDWRGDGPGFTEMEFPIIPWLMAQLYSVFGVHEIIGRILSLIFMMSSLWVFRGIALKVLPPCMAIVSCLFFVVSHEMAIVATAIQPEALMLLSYLLAVYYFVDWYERKTWISYALAVLSFALAMLVKSPAAHLAIFFFVWALGNDGGKAFRKQSLYVFAALSFAPAVFWYGHAASLWHQFHNSMGVSNEDHWLGLDILRRPKVMANLIGIDLVYVFGVGGVLVAFAAILKSRFHSAVNRLSLSWCLAVLIYLIVIIRTAGANWAAYYHVVAVPPVALLFGSGVFQLRMQGQFWWRRVIIWVVLAAVPLAAALLWASKRDNNSHLPALLRDLTLAQSSIAAITVLAVLSIAVTVLCCYLSTAKGEPSSVPTSIGIVIGCFTYFFFSSQLFMGTWSTFEKHTPQLDAADFFKGKMRANGLIVASGGICEDAAGHRVANDAPEMFYWLDRKGFTTCEGRESVAELRIYRNRGARYFIADKASLQDEPDFAAQLRQAFPLVADGDGALLFSLDAAR